MKNLGARSPIFTGLGIFLICSFGIALLNNPSRTPKGLLISFFLIVSLILVVGLGSLAFIVVVGLVSRNFRSTKNPFKDEM